MSSGRSSHRDEASSPAPTQMPVEQSPGGVNESFGSAHSNMQAPAGAVPSINAGSKRSACSTSVCAKAMPCQKSKRISAEAAAWRLALQDLLQVFSDFTRLRNIGAAFIVRSSPDGDTLNLQAPPSVKYVDRFSFADLCQHHPHVKCPSSSGRQPPPGIRACWMQFDRVLAGI
ncbi:hypothetical protein T484DRAFT_1748670 [Baffinella frigidus]|nr:hypothetical protein T484DRAFT_1748670 [Cryptophyta sp. CCMP2293]